MLSLRRLLCRVGTGREALGSQEISQPPGEGGLPAALMDRDSLLLPALLLAHRSERPPSL